MSKTNHAMLTTFRLVVLMTGALWVGACGSSSGTESGEGADPGAGTSLVPINLKLPQPLFSGTPQDVNVPNLEPPLGRPRPPFLAPAGVTNVAAGRPVTSSERVPVIGSLELVTDGANAASDNGYVELGPFLQYVTIDLGSLHDIYAVVIWHYHAQPAIYFDVVVTVADDAEFTRNVRTLFNNDIDNSAGLGVGTDRHYVETSEGKLIDAKGSRAQYLRFYSSGNSFNDLNHYTEVSVYGKSAPVVL